MSNKRVADMTPEERERKRRADRERQKRAREKRGCFGRRAAMTPEERRERHKARSRAHYAANRERLRARNTAKRKRVADMTPEEHARYKATYQRANARKRTGRSHSEAMKARWADPAFRKKMAAIRAGQPFRKKQSALRRRMWADPEYRQLKEDQSRAMWADPEYRRKLSDAMRAIFADPEYRRKSSDRLRALWADPEFRTARSDLSWLQWADPDYRQKTVQGVKRSYDIRRGVASAMLEAITLFDSLGFDLLSKLTGDKLHDMNILNDVAHNILPFLKQEIEKHASD